MREPDKVERRGCIERDQIKGLEILNITGLSFKDGKTMHSSTAAEKGDQGMALKIRSRAEGMTVGREPSRSAVGFLDPDKVNPDFRSLDIRGGTFEFYYQRMPPWFELSCRQGIVAQECPIWPVQIYYLLTVGQ